MLCKRMVLWNHLAYLINYHYMFELILEIWGLCHWPSSKHRNL